MSEQLTAYDGLLPTGVAVADSRVDLNVPLFLEEEERASSMVVSRRADFVTVRACARLALGRLGVPPVPLVPGEAGEPSWPNGIVGSMTTAAACAPPPSPSRMMRMRSALMLSRTNRSQTV